MRGNARYTVLACPACGARLAVRNNFCGSCGIDLRTRESEVPAHLQQRIRNARILLEAERKYLTILFADMVGSTALIDDSTRNRRRCCWTRLWRRWSLR